MTIRTTWFAIMMAFGVACTGLFAQEEEKDSDMLTIGSQAPALDIEHWVQDGEGKFQPVTKFEDGNVYMVEFWATWCGPCIASMPHIAELQNEYADKGFQVVSVSDEDLETVEEFLEKDVRGEEEMTYKALTKSYCLTTDPDGSVQKDYMRAAGQNGIPTAFIVGKTGLVEWIGHPMRIDEPLSQIMSDSWDRDTFAVSFKAKQKMDALISSLGRLMRQDKSDEAIELLGAAIEESEDEDVIKRLSGIRAQVMISTGAEGAAEALDNMVVDIDDAEMLNRISWSIVELSDKQDVGDDLIRAASDAVKKAIELQPDAGHIIDTLAHLEYLNGNLDKAIELTEKAVKLAGDEYPNIAEFLEELRNEKSDGDKEDKTDDDDGQ